MQRIIRNKPLLLASAIVILAMLNPFGQAIADTFISLGADYASGDYGTGTSTQTLSVPLSLKHETGPWILRANVPYVHAEGTFSREQGSVSARKYSESGLGNLTLAATYNLINTPTGFSFDIGAKTKIATADQAKTLITSGKNDYSFQVDAFRSLTNVAFFATLGYSIIGEPAGVNFKNPFYSTLGFSVPLQTGHTIGAAWDYRQKFTTRDNAVSEFTAFYSIKINPSHKIQFYAVTGLSNGSPDFGGGSVLTHIF